LCASCQGKLLSLTGSSRQQRNGSEGEKKRKEVEKESSLASMFQEDTDCQCSDLNKTRDVCNVQFHQAKSVGVRPDSAGRACAPASKPHTYHSAESDHRDATRRCYQLSIAS
jgi:hypothetical protein